MKGSDAIGLGKFVILFYQCTYQRISHPFLCYLGSDRQLFTIFLFELSGHPVIAYRLFSFIGLSPFVKVEAMIVNLPY
jgi:hypothetical protein